VGFCSGYVAGRDGQRDIAVVEHLGHFPGEYWRRVHLQGSVWVENVFCLQTVAFLTARPPCKLACAAVGFDIARG